MRPALAAPHRARKTGAIESTKVAQSHEAKESSGGGRRE